MTHHWHKKLALHSSLFGPDDTVNYDYIITNTCSINYLAQDVHVHVFPMVHTLTIVEPIWPMLQNLSKTLVYMYMYNVHVHITVCMYIVLL